MAVYLLMFAYVGVLGYAIQQYYEINQIKTKYNSGISLIGAVFVTALPIVFIGLRTDFGDTYVYTTSFNNLPLDFNSLIKDKAITDGVGFDIYQYVIKRFISSSPQAFLMITAIIQGCAVMKLYYKYSNNFTYSMLLFFFSMNFTYMMNGIRQFLAASIVYLASDYLFNKKAIRFMMVVLLAMTIHFSAVLWIPVYLIVQGKPWKARIMIAIIIMVVLIFIFATYTDVFSNVLEGFEYDSDIYKNDDGSGFIYTLLPLITVVLTIWKKKEIEEANNSIVFKLVNCVVIEVMISLLANFTSGILIGRLPAYFRVYEFILLPWLIEDVFEEKDRKLIRFVCLFGYFLYGLYYMFAKGISYSSSILSIG